MSNRSGPYGRCAICGKGCYSTKALAKAAIRQMEGREGRLAAYRCGGGAWHIGHLPESVVRGRVGRQQIGRRETA